MNEYTYGNVVDPDHVGVVDGDGITTPNVLGVDIGDSNVPGYCQRDSYSCWILILTG